MINNINSKTKLINNLYFFYASKYGSIKKEEYFDIPIGAATYNLSTIEFVKIKNKQCMSYVFEQICYRPFDKNNQNLFRNFKYKQFQILLDGSICGKTLVKNTLDYLDIESCKAEFLEDNWNAPSMSAFGLGWECRMYGLEIAQITYFNKFGGLNYNNFDTLEIVFGLERLFYIIDKKIVDYSYNEMKCDIVYNQYTKKNNLELLNILKENVINYDIDNSILNNDINNSLKDNINNSKVNKTILYQKFLIKNLAFNILDSRFYFSDSEKNLYMNIMNKIFKFYYNI